MNHRLKILKSHYIRVSEGTKTFEIRENDRVYQKGDSVTLWAFDDFLERPHDVKEFPEITFTIGDVYPIDEKRVVFSLLGVK